MWAGTKGRSIDRRRAGIRRMRAVLMVSALAGSTTLFAPGAFAQAETDQATQAQPAAPDDIVVTAQKRSERIIEVPLSVSVIKPDALLNKGSTALTDFAGSVPGLAVSNGGSPGINGVIIRGLATGYSNSFNAPLVVTYIDDQPTGASAGGFGGARGGAFTLDLMPYDIAEIEVLRGPQGTLYGANAMGGLLKYTLTRPDPTKTELRMGTTLAHVASSGGLDHAFRGALNLPIVDDQLAIRVSGFYQKTAGYIDNIGTGEKDSNKNKTYGGRVSLLYAPTGNFDVEATALVQRIRSDDRTTVNLDGQTGRPLYGRYIQSTNFPQPYSQDAENYALRVHWDFGFAALVSSTSYARMNNEVTSDLSAIPYVPSAPNALIPYIVKAQVKKFTQEARLASSSGGTLDWMVGAFYTRESPYEVNDFRAFSAPGVPLPPPNDILMLGTTPGSRNKYSEWALFTNETLRLSEKFDVSAGVRYSENRSKGCDHGFIGIYGNGGTFACQSRPKESVATWMVNARYHIQRDAMLYARIATGYRPGGGCDTCGNPLLGVPPTYDADRLTNYELGLKGLFFDRRLQLDLTGFYIDWTKIQIPVINAQGFSYPGNGKTAVSRGVELNASYALDNGLRFSGFVAYTDAKLTADAPGVGGLKDDPLPGSAKWAGAINADYRRSVGADTAILAGVGYRYKGAVDNQFRGTGQPFRMGAQNIVDLYVGANFHGTEARLFVKNLSNDRSYTGLGFLTDRSRPWFTPVQPFTVGMQLDQKF